MQQKPQRLILPFMKRRRDPVSWIYDHRAGVFSLLALALVMAILFIGSRVVIRTPVRNDGIVVDMRTVEELREEARRLEREVRIRQSAADASAIRNATSNEGAELRERLDMSSLRDEIDRTNRGLRGNRDTWDEGLREIEAMRGARDGKDDKSESKSARVAGRVLVSFSLVNPTRHEDDVPVPGYRCERFGEVVVDITVSRNGDVVAAKVNASSTDNDACMRETALTYARRSRFNIDISAPERQTGTITYTFVAQ